MTLKNRNKKDLTESSSVKQFGLIESLSRLCQRKSRQRCAVSVSRWSILKLNPFWINARINTVIHVLSDGSKTWRTLVHSVRPKLTGLATGTSLVAYNTTTLRIELKRLTILRTCTALGATSGSTNATSMLVCVMRILRQSVKNALTKPSTYAAWTLESVIFGSKIASGTAMSVTTPWRAKLHLTFSAAHSLNRSPTTCLKNANVHTVITFVTSVWKKSTMT